MIRMMLPWLGLLAVAAPVPAAVRPSIVLMHADKPGCGDPGSSGNREIHTPRIDALALLTGRYPARSIEK